MVEGDWNIDGVAFDGFSSLFAVRSSCFNQPTALALRFS